MCTDLNRSGPRSFEVGEFSLSRVVDKNIYFEIPCVGMTLKIYISTDESVMFSSQIINIVSGIPDVSDFINVRRGNVLHTTGNRVSFLLYSPTLSFDLSNFRFGVSRKL